MRRPLLPVLILQCLIILIVIEGLNLNLYSSGFTQYYNTVQTIKGRVKSVQIKDGYSALSVDVGKENILLRLSKLTDESYVYDLVGREIKATGKITEPDDARNPGCFSYRNYLRARRTYAVIQVSRFKFEAGKVVSPPAHFLSACKGKFLSAAREMMGGESFGLLAGIMFGDKGYMDDGMYESFQKNGIAHVLAVSGLHVGLVYGAMRKLLKRKDLPAGIVSIILLFFYAALANFSVSVIRAGAMILIKIIAFHLNRRYDMLSAACLVAIVLLAYNPYYIYDSGAQLSFLAAYSIAVIMPWAESRLKSYCDKRKKDRLYKVLSPFLPGIVLQVSMVPLTAFHFLNFSPLSIFINPIAIYLASLILPAGLVCFLVFPFKMLLAAGSGVIQGICLALTKLTELSDTICGGFTVSAPPFTLLALYYVLLFFFFSESRHILLRQKKDKAICLIYAGLIASACFFPVLLGISQSPLPWRYNRYDAVFLDVGQGDSTHIQSRGVNVLVDGGGSYYSDVAENTLKPYLLKNGITKIDIAIVTHLDTDHSKGIADLSQMMKIGMIVFPVSADGEDLSAFRAENIVFADAGDIIEAGDARFSVLSADGPDANSGSLISLCEVNGSRILLMGDAPKEKEMEISFPKADILKAGHHGSKTSTGSKLLKEAKPRYAVISCGRDNRYHHPSDSVLELLQNSGIIIKRTDLEGAICLKKQNILTKY